MYLSFKRGSVYTRESIGEICYPGIGRPKGGNWDTGYVHVENNLIIWMNIGVAGRTGHDFDNSFDEKTNTITWFGKPNTHSGQGTFKNLFDGSLTPHFFARGNANNPEFIYLGVGSIVNFKDNVQTKHGNAICLTLTLIDAKDIMVSSLPELEIEVTSEELITTQSSSFVLEKHLEDYLCKNWSDTIFGHNYDICENGRQYQTDTGPLDILAQKKDKTEFMVLELKRDKVSDAAVSQTLRYINYVRRTLAINDEQVKGCIIGTEEDRALMNAIEEVPNIDFYRYDIKFSLDLVSR
jgi:hypothetical protein